jgi:hypothetical protein
MSEILEKIKNALQNDFIESNVNRNSDRHKNSRHLRSSSSTDTSKCEDYTYYKSFSIDGQKYRICLNYRKLDIEYKGHHVTAEHIEYCVHDSMSNMYGINTKTKDIQSFEKYFDDFDSNCDEYREILKCELNSAGFPQHIKDMIINAEDLSNGFLIHNTYSGTKYEKISMVEEFDPEKYKDYYLILLDKSWHNMDNYSQHDDYLADLLDNFEISLDNKALSIMEWTSEHCHGNVIIYGGAYGWYILMFEDKNDAMIYKMTWK